MNKLSTLMLLVAIMTSCSCFTEQGAGNWIKSISLGTPPIDFWIIKGERKEGSYLFKVNAFDASGENVITQYGVFLNEHYDVKLASNEYDTKILIEVESINSVSLDSIVKVTQEYFLIQKVEYNLIQNWIILDVRRKQ